MALAMNRPTELYELYEVVRGATVRLIFIGTALECRTLARELCLVRYGWIVDPAECDLNEDQWAHPLSTTHDLLTLDYFSRPLHLD